MINNSSRRRALKFATLLTAGALVITGCSAEDNSTTQATESSSNEAGGEDSAAQGDTRTVTDYEGNEVEVPSDPQRVVTLHFAATEALVDLGWHLLVRVVTPKACCHQKRPRTSKMFLRSVNAKASNWKQSLLWNLT